MLYGDRSMAVRLDNLKKMISTDERLVDLKNNPLLDILNYDKVDSEIMDTPSLLTTPGSRISDKNSKDMVTLGWKDMLTFTHPDTKIEKAVQTFAKDLINYAWISSGSNPGPNSIYSYIPFDYLIDNGFNQFVKDKLESINNTNDLSEILTEESIESIYKNLWNNDNIVPLIKNEYVQLLNNKQTVKATSKIHGVSYNKTLVFPLKLVRSLKLNTNGVYKPFIKVKINKDNVKDQVFTVLYKFVGVNQERDKKGNIREIPVYNAVNKKGYFNKGKNIFEFNTLNNSTFTFNNVEEGSYIPYIEEPIIKVNDFSMTEEQELETYNIGEIDFQEEPTSGYRNRTIKNASADATIALATDFSSAGEKLTKTSVLNQNKKYIALNANDLTITKERVNKIIQELNSVNAITLNIAGNGIYTMKNQYTQQQVDDFTYTLLLQVLTSPDLITPIQSIRSGGQTGFDEAGAKAGMKLGIPTIVLAPKGWTFRTVLGKDISNEQLFKARFKTENSVINASLLDKVKDITDEQANERKEQC